MIQMVKQSLGVNERDIKVEPIPPSAWSSHFLSLCRQFGFLSFHSSQLSSHAPDRVLVYHPHTKRLIGGEKAFRKLIDTKYGITCDIPWSLLQSIARETCANFSSVSDATRIAQLTAPTILAVLGPPGSGVSTLARKMEGKYGMKRISVGEMMRQAINQTTNATATPLPASITAEQVASIRASLLSGELVADSIVLPLVLARLSSPDVQSVGAILDGFPRTCAQASALQDWASRIGQVTTIIRLMGRSETPEEDAAARDPTTVIDEFTESAAFDRIRGRRLDPLTGDIYHLGNVIPSQAMVLSRLVRRFEDAAAAAAPSSVNGLASLVHAQYRAYTQQTQPVYALFSKSIIRPIDCARPSPDQLMEEVTQILDPIVTQLQATREQARVQQAKKWKEDVARLASEPHLPPRLPPAPAAAAAPSSSPNPTATPASASTPVPVTPTPADVAQAVVATMPPSRRNSAGSRRASATQSTTTPTPQAEVTNTRATNVGSRRNSAGSRRGSETNPPVVGSSSSKPASRRVSGVFAGDVAAGAGAPAGGATPASLSRRVSRRISAARASGVPLVPAGVLKEQPNQAQSPVATTTTLTRPTTADAQQAEEEQQQDENPVAAAAAAAPASKPGSKRGSGEAVPSPPVTSSRPSSGVADGAPSSSSDPASSSAPSNHDSDSAAASESQPSAAAVDGDEEVVLHHKKRTTKRASVPKPDTQSETTTNLQNEQDSTNTNTNTATNENETDPAPPSNANDDAAISRPTSAQQSDAPIEPSDAPAEADAEVEAEPEADVDADVDAESTAGGQDAQADDDVDAADDAEADDADAPEEAEEEEEDDAPADEETAEPDEEPEEPQSEPQSEQEDVEG